jgi:diadenosine tetraphosphate (Ap4A) HIT family hydrolase
MELYKGKYWTVTFGVWCQDHPGYCIVGNDKESLSELSSDEWIELGIIEKELERVCKKLFDATMFNFACLMNNAYRDGETPKVHYHFVPRYKNELKLFNKVYRDRHFGFNFWKWNLSKFKAQKDPYTEDERKEIFKMMKDEWSL